MYNNYVRSNPDKPAFSAPKNWEYTSFEIKGVHMEKLVLPKCKDRRVVLQLHGGAYLYGITDDYRRLAVKESEIAGKVPVYLLDYKLAPEYKFPAALEDALTCYQYLLDSGFTAKDIIVLGDSAGGNLALALSLYLRDHNLE